MTIYLEMDDDWYDQYMLQINKLIMGVTVAVREDAQTACPVDTGDLKESLVEVNPEPGVGRVQSDVTYCLSVEFGDHNEQWVRAHTRKGHHVQAHSRWANGPEQPYFRPAVYRVRALPDYVSAGVV